MVTRLQLVFDVLKKTDLLQADDQSTLDLASARQRQRQTVSESLLLAQRSFNRSPSRCARGREHKIGGFDGNAWQDKFVPQLTALRQKAREHGEDDAWLDKIPSHYTAVNQIADALVSCNVEKLNKWRGPLVLLYKEGEHGERAPQGRVDPDGRRTAAIGLVGPPIAIGTAGGPTRGIVLACAEGYRQQGRGRDAPHVTPGDGRQMAWAFCATAVSTVV